MPRATVSFRKRIAIVFDFDLTLGEGSVDVLLAKLGADPERFREDKRRPLDAAGWDHALARCQALIDLSESLGGAITEDLPQLAKGLPLAGTDAPADVYRAVPEPERHVPFDRMIHGGAGASDMPAFDLIGGRGGIALCVFGPDALAAGWSAHQSLHTDRRVENLALGE